MRKAKINSLLWSQPNTEVIFLFMSSILWLCKFIYPRGNRTLTWNIIEPSRRGQSELNCYLYSAYCLNRIIATPWDIFNAPTFRAAKHRRQRTGIPVRAMKMALKLAHINPSVSAKSYCRETKAIEAFSWALAALCPFFQSHADPVLIACRPNILLAHHRPHESCKIAWRPIREPHVYPL